ncbi:Collagen triple helix repeat [uncultured Caudovirales phage]|uniref:Collagen triple helix repeat n=1 Tax=uncultured Caudovirales phage TaxID=2100421 RepID=A0A6J5S9P9_9CAUD|nr:Collagen triple helix repeat [uncultured Caudovirales phage]CAB4197855.1 Collagen triple helix repeat [uncultured Caudovirales phage]CAB4210298.1 Collagen triple helix repeat [uncultured Caudovirales phage]
MKPEFNPITRQLEFKAPSLRVVPEPVVGPQGPAGKDGLNGRDGRDGKDGADGLNGLDGRDGKDGLSGRDGKDGLQGLTGRDGKDGLRGAQMFSVILDPAQTLGEDGDFAIAATGNLFQKQKGAWSLFASFGGARGARGPAGSSGAATENFESVSSNLNGYAATLAYVGGRLSAVTYAKPGGDIVKTLNYTGDDLTSIVLSGNTPVGIALTKTFVYSGGNLISTTIS